MTLVGVFKKSTDMHDKAVANSWEQQHLDLPQLQQSSDLCARPRATSYGVFVDAKLPNPFKPSRTIRYGLLSRSDVSIVITNTVGQQVAVLENGEREAGYHEVEWHANVSSGIYFYRIDAVSTSDPNNRFGQVKKTLLLK